MKRQGRLALLIGALVVVGASGCGSGSSDAPTKAAFIKRADVICEQRKNEEIAAFSTYLAKSQKQNLSGQAQARFVIGGVFQPIEAMTGEIRDLGSPDGDEDQVNEIVEAFEDIVKEGRANPAKVFSAEAPYGSADKLAAAYGLKACSEF